MGATDWAWQVLAISGQQIAFPPDDGGAEVLVLETVEQRSARQWIIVLAPIDWDFRRQRPHRIAGGLAKQEFNVVYVDATVDRGTVGLRLRLVGPHTYVARLSAPGAGSPYDGPATGNVADRLVEAIETLRLRLGSIDMWIGVMLPYWTDVALKLRERNGWRIWYDRMDDWSGFQRIGSAYGAAEATLMTEMDCGTATAHSLIAPSFRLTLVPNACDQLFVELPFLSNGSPHGRRIGYVGAIAEWFDFEIIRQLAALPNVEIMLYGAMSVEVEPADLLRLANVTFAGEVAHSRVAGIIDSLDVCILPFLSLPLTQSTDPVKVYEYLARGKAVVASELPELLRFHDSIRIAKHRDHFVTCVLEALNESDQPAEERESARINRRDAVRGHTWDYRAATIAKLLNSVPPKVSVVVLNWNNARLTAATISVLLATKTYPNVEIICVDNGSLSEDRFQLRRLLSDRTEVVLVQNDSNLGFAAGMNEGVRRSTGEILVLLNNDAFIGPGGIEAFEARLRDPQIGLVGPVTNWTGNEAKIDLSPSDFGEFLGAAMRRRLLHVGGVSTTKNLAFFCVALRRKTWDLVGELDISFGTGMFEDDDYCRRVAGLGLEISILEDTFVYHIGEATFGSLRDDGRYAKLFADNKVVFEEKWNQRWEPHTHTGAAFVRRNYQRSASCEPEYIRSAERGTVAD